MTSNQLAGSRRRRHTASITSVQGGTPSSSVQATDSSQTEYHISSSPAQSSAGSCQAQSPGSVQGDSSQSNASSDLHIDSECPIRFIHSATRSPFSPSSSRQSISPSVLCSNIQVTPEPELMSASGSLYSTEGSPYSAEGNEVSASLNDAQESEKSHRVQVTVNAALASQLDLVSSENVGLKVELETAKKTLFRIENIPQDSPLITLYTGFGSYEVLMSFFAFLGPSTSCLRYWGSKGKGERRRKTTIKPILFNPYKAST